MRCHHNLPNYNNITFFFFFFSCLGHLFEGWKEKGFCCCDVQESATSQSPSNMPFLPWFFKKNKNGTLLMFMPYYTFKAPVKKSLLTLFTFYRFSFSIIITMTPPKKKKNWLKTASYSKLRIIKYVFTSSRHEIVSGKAHFLREILEYIICILEFLIF